MLEGSVAWILFPLGVALGWYIARQSPGTHSARPMTHSVDGISTLVNDDPDQAVAALINTAELTEESVELHLTLGSLFRRRGEVDRALRVHQALSLRPELTDAQRSRAEFELAEDYLKAGVLDRAEQMYANLAARGFKLTACLESIIGIHESSRDWPQAIEASYRLEASSGVSRRAVTAQYECEMAEAALLNKDSLLAARHVKKALGIDKRCARAHLISGRIAQQLRDWADATSSYAKVAELEHRLMPEVVQSLWDCCRDWGRPEYFVQWLEDLPDDRKLGAAEVVHAELMSETGLDASGFLLDAFESQPSWSVLERVAALNASENMQVANRSSAAMRVAVGTLIRARHKYQCQSCGMTPAQLLWRCPSCKQWGVIFPMDDRLLVEQSPLP